MLGQLAPEVSKAASALLGNRDPQATESFRGEAKQGLTLSKSIIDAPSFAAKQKILADEVGKVAGQGGDVDRLVKLSNLSEDQLDLELQKMQIVGKGMLKAVPSVKAGESLKFFSSEKRRNAFAKVAASNPRIAQSLMAGRDRQIGREDRRARESAAAAKAAAAPKTDLGKTIAGVQSDVANGVISQAIGNKIINQARAKAVASAPPKFQSDVGKLVGDVEAASELFGADSPQVTALNEALAGKIKGEGPKLNEVAGVRKEFTAQSGEFVTLRNAIGKIRTASEIAGTGDSAAADLSMVFSYMKMLDPGSVVRESEFATAEKARGVPESVRNTYNKVVTGEILTDKQRNDFTNVANQIFDQALTDQRALEEQFTGISTRNNIDPLDVVVDFIGDSGGPGPDTTEQEFSSKTPGGIGFTVNR